MKQGAHSPSMPCNFCRCLRRTADGRSISDLGTLPAKSTSVPCDRRSSTHQSNLPMEQLRQGTLTSNSEAQREIFSHLHCPALTSAFSAPWWTLWSSTCLKRVASPASDHVLWTGWPDSGSFLCCLPCLPVFASHVQLNIVGNKAGGAGQQGN